MKLATLQKFGGVALITGSLLLTLYSISFQFLLPMDQIRKDYSLLINNANWVWIAVVAFSGVVLMIFGFFSAYSRICEESGWTGFAGFVLVELAYLFQACKVSWEIFLYPVIASFPGSMPLFRDSILRNSPMVVGFRSIASITILSGIIFFCLALVRSKAYPKAAGILIFFGALLYGLGPLLAAPVAISGICILSIGCFVTGISLFKSPA